MTSLPLNVGAPAVAVPSVMVAVAAVIALLKVSTIVAAGPRRGSVVGLVANTKDSGRLKVPAVPWTFRDTALASVGGGVAEPGVTLFDGAEGPLVPSVVDAVTVNV